MTEAIGMYILVRVRESAQAMERDAAERSVADAVQRFALRLT